jgi:hypothetical protein
MEDVCPARDRNVNVFVRVLHDACRILGGEHKLAEYLGVSVMLVEFWLDGHGQLPDSVFLRCSDLLHERSS